ncbi:MAG TPA: hypothetical protein VGM54_03275 [Chthoniobacter sp.]|jgi:hypothetical protein
MPALPPELDLAAEEIPALRIKARLLRARLESDDETTESPLSLARLVTLLDTMVNHSLEMEKLLQGVWQAWSQISRKGLRAESTVTGNSLATEMWAALAGPGGQGLEAILKRQRSATQLCLIFQGLMKVAGTELAREIAAKLDPAAVVAAVRSTKPQARAEDFWRHYESQADHLTPGELERCFHQSIASAAHQFLSQAIPLSS